MGRQKKSCIGYLTPKKEYIFEIHLGVFGGNETIYEVKAATAEIKSGMLFLSNADGELISATTSYAYFVRKEVPKEE